MKIINTFMCEGIAQQDLVNQQLQMLNNHSDNITGRKNSYIVDQFQNTFPSFLSIYTLHLLLTVFPSTYHTPI